jgi:hypothetical protein
MLRRGRFDGEVHHILVDCRAGGCSDQSRLSDLLDCSKFVDYRRLSVSQVSRGDFATFTAGSHVGARAGESATRDL